ncbi:unnamed protein product [Gadus morhua 'NCC']
MLADEPQLGDKSHIKAVSTLAHALSNGPWKGLYLADEDAPHQYQSNSCGVFMLMGDMLSIRRWWLDCCWRPLCLKALQD